MSLRMQIQSQLKVSPELTRLLAKAHSWESSDDELREQQISFAYGNAFSDSPFITKESVRAAAQRLRLLDVRRSK